MIDDTMVTKAAGIIDHLDKDANTGGWLRDFLQRKPSAGFYDAMGAPIEYLIRGSANHPRRTVTAAKWVEQRLKAVVDRGAPLVREISDEFLLEALFGWCEQREEPARFADLLLGILELGDNGERAEWTRDLLRAFKSALARNQRDASLKEFWIDLLDGTKRDHQFVRNWDMDFHGLLHMQAADGIFDWDAIGRALKSVYETLFPETRPIMRSPLGPIRGLYEDLAVAANLSEPELSEKLWEMAESNGWSIAQQHTIPRQFFELTGGKAMLVPRVAIDLMLAWKNIPCKLSQDLLVAIIEMANINRLSDVETQTIEDYERERRSSPVPPSEQGLFAHQMYVYFDEARIGRVVRKRNAIGGSIQIRQKFGSALYQGTPVAAFESEMEKYAQEPV